MDILSMIMNANGGENIAQLASTLGLGQDQASSALQQLVPALTSGLKRGSGASGGLQSLLGALQSGGHQRYLEDPGTLGQAATISDGNSILGHILGSKDVSRQVASRAADKTGVDAGILKIMLPMVATMVMGAMSQGTSQGRQSGGGGDALGMLGSLLDSDQDGSIADDLLGFAKKLF